MLHQVVEGGPLDGPIFFPHRNHYIQTMQEQEVGGRMNVEVNILLTFNIREVLIRRTEVVGAS